MGDLGLFRAVVAEARGLPARFVDVGEEDLGAGEVVVGITHSSLNYKDALAVTARAPVVRRFPMVVGIDLAGRVLESTSPAVAEGAEVLVVGNGLGEEHPGGFSRFARVPAEWCVALPGGLDAEGAMTLGTAGLTAMLACLALERNGALPASDDLPVLVTGAAGGVGSFAVALLSRLGCSVTASTGRMEEADYLRALGAAEVVDRRSLSPDGGGPLAGAQFSAAVDVVGGSTLAEVLRRVAPDGAVAACGLAGGADLHSTVYPFILRGVTLAGVNAAHPPRAAALLAWRRLAELLPAELLALVRRVEALGQVFDLSAEVLAGRIRGRVVLDVAS